jgi:hypothetical protein
MTKKDVEIGNFYICILIKNVLQIEIEGGTLLIHFRVKDARLGYLLLKDEINLLSFISIIVVIVAIVVVIVVVVVVVDEWQCILHNN